jgi:TolB-like protein
MPTVPGRWVVWIIVAFSGIMVSIAAVMLFGHPRGKIAPPPSIAVLPVMGDPELAGEIIETLNAIPKFQIRDGSVFAGKRSDTRAIGEKLNVRTVLDGSVTNGRVTVKLINAADAFELWSHDYESVAAVKNDLARDVAAQLSLK